MVVGGWVSRLGGILLTAVFGVGIAHVGHAQTWPAKPVRVIVAFPAGGATDLVARLIGQALGKVYAQQFVIENRPGAGGNVGAEIVAKAAPDGHTVFLSTPGPQANNQFLYRQLGFDPQKDFTPIITVSEVPQIIVASTKVPIRSIPDLIDYARKNPGKLNYASPGNGTTSHLTAELLRHRAGVNMVHVPYRGAAPALQDLLAGAVDVGFDQLPPYVSFVESKQIQGVAVTSAKRWFALKEVPTVEESGVPDFQVTMWFGLFGPAGLSAPLVADLNRHLNEYIASAEGSKRLLDLGSQPVGGTPQQLGDLVRAEAERWGPIIKELGIHLD
jgi:tripartite-type tricarboxylate transporter receptor subunit TctC